MLFGLGLIAWVWWLRPYSWEGIDPAPLFCFWWRGHWMEYDGRAGINCVDRTGDLRIFPGVRVINAAGLFRGRGHCMRGIDSLGGGI